MKRRSNVSKIPGVPRLLPFKDGAVDETAAGHEMQLMRLNDCYFRWLIYHETRPVAWTTQQLAEKTRAVHEALGDAPACTSDNVYADPNDTCQKQLLRRRATKRGSAGLRWTKSPVRCSRRHNRCESLL